MRTKGYPPTIGQACAMIGVPNPVSHFDLVALGVRLASHGITTNAPECFAHHSVETCELCLDYQFAAERLSRAFSEYGATK